MQYTWNDIERHVAACTHCPLSRTRQRPVMGRGDHQAALMLIAEASCITRETSRILFSTEVIISDC